MALKGTLGDFPLPDIFQLIIHQRKSGILTVNSNGDFFKIGIENGSIVMADYIPKYRKNYLGEMLLKAKLINEQQLNKSLHIQKQTFKKIGDILVNDLKAISKEELSQFLNLQIKEIIFKLFSITEGEYEFQPMRVNYDRELIKPVSSEFILMEGMRIIDEWPQIRKYIPYFGIVFKRTKEPLSLSEKEKRIYELVDGIKSVREIIDVGRIGEFETCYILSKFIMNGFIEKAEEKIEMIEEINEEGKVEDEELKKRGNGIIYAIIAIIIFIFAIFKFGIISSNQGDIFHNFISEIKILKKGF
jgi:hypothetical protein